jgi:hypothetical protein
MVTAVFRTPSGTDEIVFVPSLSVYDPNLQITQISVAQNVNTFNYTSEAVKLKYQSRAEQYSVYSLVLSYTLIIGSGILYLMGHDSVGMATSGQLVFVCYMGNPPATVDQLAWGSHGYPAALVLADSLFGRWLLPLALFLLTLFVGAVLKWMRLSYFGFWMTVSGAEGLVEANPGLLLPRNTFRTIARVWAVRAVQWLAQVARFPLLACCLTGLRTGSPDIRSLALAVLTLLVLVPVFTIVDDFLNND